MMVERRRSPRRKSLVGIFFGNALLLAFAMLWYAIVYTGTTTHSSAPTGMLPSRTSFGSLKTKKQKSRFHRPLPMGGQVQNTMSVLEQETEAAAAAVIEESEEAALQLSGERATPVADAIIPLKSPSSGHACSKYEGVLHIQSGDQGAAAGTLFFQYMINQLIYADMYNLIPLIHLNNVTYNVFDEKIHGAGDGLTLNISGTLAVKLETLPQKGGWPGNPYLRDIYGNGARLWFRGTGVWNHYLEPVSQYDPSHPECQALNYLTLDYEFLNPGIQFYAPWAVRSWEYQHIPEYLSAKGSTNGHLHEWFAPQRVRAHEIVKKYFQFKPHLVQAASELVPDGTQCLAVHIRHSDKAGLARRKIPTEKFLTYINEYIMNGGGQVYLATDSSRVLELVQRHWLHVKLIAQSGIIRSAVRKPVFRQGTHNRTNTEVLVDILAMARCQFMVHGYSAVSESSHYLNLNLHKRSVDLEDPEHMNTTQFGTLVKSEINIL